MTSSSVELCVAHELCVLLQHVRHALLVGRWEYGAGFGLAVKLMDSVASMMAPAKANPKDSPNDPAAEFVLAASLTRSSEIGRERVVVELRHQQAQP